MQKTQMNLWNSTIVEKKGNNYDYDIINGYENINMDIQFSCNLILLIVTIKNFFNVRKWCIQKQVKPYKLYCIHSNTLIVLLCIILYIFLK